MNTHNSIFLEELNQFFNDCDPLIVASNDDQGTSSEEIRFGTEELKRFFSDLDFRLEIQIKCQRQLDHRLAGNFNVFQWIHPDENGLSDILAMLLDPQGAHGQQDLFLNLFLKRLERTSQSIGRDAKVVREALTHNIGSSLRRIDILATCEHFALAIENKLDSIEQENQLKDYWENIEKSRKQDYCLVFLTPDGRKTKSIDPDAAAKLRRELKLFELSYSSDVCQWLEECRRWCEAEKVRHFLTDFIQHIKTRVSS